MSSNKTSLGLNQWDSTDKLQRMDFNKDNEIINAQLVSKVGTNSPALTGTPTAPTAATTTNNTQIATTAYVQANLASKANLSSPALTGTPTAPTAATATNTTQIATTAFVQANLATALDVSKAAAGTLPIARGGTGNTTNTAAACTGNSATATKLATARAINGVNFDGTAAITVYPVSNENVCKGGALALNSNTTGFGNTAFGTYSMYRNTTGSYSTAFGYNTLNALTQASNQSAFGYSALSCNTTGANNCAFGHCALQLNTTGEYNNALGYYALRDNTTGYYNTALGYRALTFNKTGSENTAIGQNAGIHTNTALNNTISIGSRSMPTANNQIVLGNSDNTSLRCQVTAITALSDTRVKEDIQSADLTLCYKAVRDLPVTRYKYKAFTGKHLDTHVTGWMADDVEKVFPKAVQKSDVPFPELDENGQEVYEDVIEKITTLDADGNEVITENKVSKRKEFVMKDVKDITMSEALPTLWGAVQQLMSVVEANTATIQAQQKEIDDMKIIIHTLTQQDQN